MKKAVLLIEDDKSLNRGISLKLSKEGYETHAAFTLLEGERILRETDIQLVICDIGLPDGNGLDFCRRLRRENKQVFFLFLTAMDTEMDMVNGYEAGADDYITKPFSLMVLLSKVNAMMRRSEKKSNAVLCSGELVFFEKEKRFQKKGEYLNLSPNEWKLLHMFLNHPKQIFSKEQIVEKLWDIDQEYFDINAVAVNIRRLREKIEEDPSNPVYIKNIRGLGYVWEKECSRE